jgi:hypothetical protein
LNDAKEELASKDTEIERLTKAHRRAAELVEYRGYRSDKTHDGKPKGAPYCPVCACRLKWSMQHRQWPR